MNWNFSTGFRFLPDLLGEAVVEDGSTLDSKVGAGVCTVKVTGSCGTSTGDVRSSAEGGGVRTGAIGASVTGTVPGVEATGCSQLSSNSTSKSSSELK